MYPCIEFTNYKQVDKTDELKFVAVPEKRLKESKIISFQNAKRIHTVRKHYVNFQKTENNAASYFGIYGNVVKIKRNRWG